MRVVVLLPRVNPAAEWAFNRLLDHDEIEVVGVVCLDNTFRSRRYWNYLFAGVKRWGVFYAFLVGLFYTLHSVGLLLAGLLWWRIKRRWVAVDKLIKRHGLMVHNTLDINTPESLEILRSWEPDVVVSMYFDQILKKEALSIAKLMNINMHPAPLPSYKGLWPSFWMLYNRATKAGVTVHQMTEQLDSGDVLASTSFPIRKEDTQYSLMLRSASYGVQTLTDVLLKLKQGVPLPSLKQQGASRSYSLPSRKQFREFFLRKKRLFWIPLELKQLDELA